MNNMQHLIQWLVERNNLPLLNKLEQVDTIKAFIDLLDSEEIQWLKEQINKQYIFLYNEPIKESDEQLMMMVLEMKSYISEKS